MVMAKQGFLIALYAALLVGPGRSDSVSGPEIPEITAVASPSDESIVRGKREPDHTSLSWPITNAPQRFQDLKDVPASRNFDRMKDTQTHPRGAAAAGIREEDFIGSMSDYQSQIEKHKLPDFFGGGNITEQYFSYLIDLVNREQKKNPTRVIKSIEDLKIGGSASGTLLTENEYTVQHPPPVGVSIVNTTLTSIRVRWRTPSRYPVQYYISILRAEDDTDDQLVADPRNQRHDRVTAMQEDYEFTGLEEGTEYLIRILALYADGVKSTTANVTGFTSIPAPSALIITKITDNSFKASWVPAPRTRGITGIRVRIEEIGGTYTQTTVLRPKVSHAKFTDLKPATRYLIELWSEKRGALSQKLFSEVTTGDSKPQAKLNSADTIKDEIRYILQGDKSYREKEKPSGYIEECQKTKMTDLVILIDGSWSVGPDNFNKMKNFLISLAQAFHIGFDGVLMGVAQYSDDPRTEFALNEHVTKDSLIEAIGRVEYKGGNTATGQALDYLREKMFSPEDGSREGKIRKTAVVITDGESILDDVKEPAQKLRSTGVEVFSVGVGAALRSELEDIATDPDTDHLFSVQNFDDIQSIKDKLLKDVCKSIPVCSTPPAPSNGRVSCNNDHLTPGTVCTFVCDSPLYKLKERSEAEAGQATRSCTEEGTWQVPRPSCVPAVCEDLEPPLKGRYECTAEFQIGSYCTLRCDEGYKASGEVRSRCRKDSLWTSTDAECIRILCPPITALANGAVTCDAGNVYQSTCTFSCNEGFEMQGQPSTQCTSAERWSRPAAVCTKITCSRLSALSNGGFVCSDGENYASRCTFTCLDGYELTGSDGATCVNGGSWVFSVESKMPVCERILCNFIPLTQHLSKRCTRSNNYGSTCTFECDTGYNIIGARASTCTGTRSPGIWSEKPPECRLATCNELQSPTHGRVTCTDEWNYLSRCSLVCEIGYEVKGRSQMDCDSNGRWKGKLSTCGRIMCGEIDPIAHGIVDCSDFDNYNSNCRYQCHVGYKMIAGSRVRVCGADKSYSGETPKCTIKECGALISPENGAVRCSHSSYYGSVCRYSCNLGYELVGDDADDLGRVQRLCQDDERWSGSQPTCEKITCEDLVPPVNGDAVCTENSSFGSICKFACRLGYEMVGPAERMCLENKQWTGVNTECLLVTCGPMTSPDNGRASCSAADSPDGGEMQSLDGFGTQCDFECNEGYIMTGSRRRTCGNDRLWSGAEVACVRIRCPVIPEPMHASISCTATNEYGSDCVVECDVGYYLSKGSAKRTCQKNSNWSGIEAACSVKTCENLVAKSHTTITCTNGKRYGSICTIKAEVGYKLRGPNVISCTDSGADDPPPADLITCPPMETPTSGLMTCTKGSEYDSVCSFICLEGYDLIGPTSRTCLLNAKWTDEPTSCILATCVKLEDPDNGEVSCTKGNAYQSACTFSCDEGYKLNGPVVRTCRANHDWTGSEAICVRIKCEELYAPKNGFIECSNENDFSSSCRIECNEGYKLRGSSVRTCRGDHTWDGPSSSCLGITCPEMPTPRNGRIKCSDFNNYASECEFVCEVGYLFSGSKVRTCRNDQQWTGYDVTCKIITCGELETPGNGSKRCEDNDNYDSKCSFVCDLGFDLIGSKGRTCQADGSWSGKPTSCSLVRCGEIQKLKEGNVSCSSGDQYESVCKYECKVGHDLIGTSTRVCQADHTWTGTQPLCQVVRCGTLKAPKNGAITCSNRDRFASACSYSCEEGYRLTEEFTRVCGEDHMWSGVQPTCELITCDEFELPAHGIVECSRDRYYSSECRITAKPGYSWNGPEYIRCGPDGDWSSADLDNFEIVTCDELTAPQNGQIKCSQGNYFSSTCTFTCDVGYELLGSASRTCEAQDWAGQLVEWSGEKTACAVIECPPVRDPTNGKVDCSEEFRFSSQCQFVCNEGYDLIGTSKASCQLSRKWTKEPPICVLITCGAIPSPQYGSSTCSSGDTYNSVCTFRCNEGYRHFGSETRTCLATHLWSGVEPSCILIRCDAQEAPAHGSISCSAGDAFSSTCTFVCNPGYRLIGDEVATCGAFGMWIGGTPVCEMIRCEELHSPTNGEIKCTSGNDYNSICRVFCATGYKLLGTQTRVCLEDGTFSGTPSSCKLITCEALDELNSGSILCDDGTNFNSECHHLCDDGYNLIGTTTRKCLSSGRWSDTKPYCERVKCRKLRTPMHSELSCTKNNEARSVCTVTCDSCYNIIGSPMRTCRSDGSWSGEEAACIASQCDPLRTPLNGIKDCGMLMDECGNTCNFSCKQGFRLTGSQSRTCQENGFWTGQPPECIRNECPLLLNLDSEVIMNCTDRNRIGSNCSFTCSGNGTSLVGSSHRVCTKQGVWSNTNPVCRACKTAVSDIMFIVDGSWSVGTENFGKAKDFLKALVQPFQVGWDNSRFAVIQYSDDPRTEFLLTDHLTTDEVMSAIDAIPYKGGNTNTGRAIAFSLYKALSLSNGARPFVSKTALVLTDGRSQDEVGNPAREMRNAGIRVVTVGVGDADIHELRQMASPPYDSTVYHVSDYDSIKQIQTLLAAKLCESDRPANLGMCDCPAGPPGPPGKQGLPGIPGVPGVTVKGERGEAFSIVHVNYEDQTIQAKNGDGSMVNLDLPAGLKPINGVPGVQGLQGRSGVPGTAGAAGPPGPEGPPGPKGDEGPIGPPGIPGEKGESAFSRPLSATDKSEILSRAREMAVQIAQDEIRKAFGQLDRDRRVATRDSAQSRNYRNVVGRPGPPGPPGPQGAHGFEGPPGLRGMPGVAGQKGNAGEKGDMGDMGPRGPPGIGVPGPPGEPGPRGPRGKTGRPGKGKVGSRGPRGPRGQPGKLMYRNRKSPPTQPGLDINRH